MVHAEAQYVTKPHQIHLPVPSKFKELNRNQAEPLFPLIYQTMVVYMKR
jgi:hypothetical protein